MLDHPHVQSGARQCDADEATLFLRSDNTVDRVLARGNVLVKAQGSQPAEARSEQLELIMAKQHDTLRTAIFSGDVQTQIADRQIRGGRASPPVCPERSRGMKPPRAAPTDQARKEWPMQGKAGRVVLEFASKNFLTKVHAEDNVKLLQHQNPATAPSSAQDLELTAQGMDFFMAANLMRMKGKPPRPR